MLRRDSFGRFVRQTLKNFVGREAKNVFNARGKWYGA
jgi:hypothetical protein